MSETGSTTDTNTTDTKTLYFSGALINNSQGITITDGMVKEVANPFLDLSSIVTGKSKFYFLADDDDTHYDQIVLQNLYNALESITSCEMLPKESSELIELMIGLIFKESGKSELTTLKGDTITENDLKNKDFSSTDELSSFLRENIFFDKDEIKTYANAAFTGNDIGSINSLCSHLVDKYGVSNEFVYETLLGFIKKDRNYVPESVYLTSECTRLDENGKEVKSYTNGDGDNFDLYYDNAQGCYCTKKSDGSFDKTIYDILGLTKEKFVKYGNYYAMYDIDGVTYNYGSSDSTEDEAVHKYTSSNDKVLLVFSNEDSLNAAGSEGSVEKYPKKITYDGVDYDLQTIGDEENLVPDKSNDGTCVRYKNGDTVILVSILSDVDTKKKCETKEYNGRSVLFDEKNNEYTWSNDEQTYIDKNGYTIYEHFGVKNKTLTEISGEELFKKIFIYDNGNHLSDNDAELAYQAWWGGQSISDITLGNKKLKQKSGSNLKNDEKPEYWGINFDSDAKQVHKAWQISQIINDERSIVYDNYDSFVNNIIDKVKTWVGDSKIDSSNLVANFVENYTGSVVEALANDNTGKYKNLTDKIKEAQNNLLNLCLLSSSPRTKTTNREIGYDKINHEIIAPTNRKEEYSDTYCLASGVKRITNPDGSYSYKIVKASGEEGKISADDLKNSFTKVDALFKPDENRFVTSTISWYAMAIMYEKVAIQQMVLAEQLNQIEKINEEIRYNNKVLSTLSELYNRAYSQMIVRANGDKDETKTIELKDIWNGTAKELTDYLECKVNTGTICKNKDSPKGYGDASSDTANRFVAILDENEIAKCVVPYAHFNKSGENVRGKGEDDTENIDVHEQAALNMISTWQDQVRMYGDSLSTDAQLMTTKMEQYIQNVNSSLTTCTQTVKAVGDLCKAITQNIR
jgi:hypothetical protein